MRRIKMLEFALRMERSVCLMLTATPITAYSHKIVTDQNSSLREPILYLPPNLPPSKRRLRVQLRARRKTTPAATKTAAAVAPREAKVLSNLSAFVQYTTHGSPQTRHFHLRTAYLCQACPMGCLPLATVGQQLGLVLGPAPRVLQPISWARARRHQDGIRRAAPKAGIT
jgi:hypothetical protein